MCEYCNNERQVIVDTPDCGVFVNRGKLVVYDYALRDVTEENINFCPMCGRKLEAQDAKS
jgi:hypothetical protein